MIMASMADERTPARGLAWAGVLLALGGPAVLVTLSHAGLFELTELQRRMATWITLWSLTLVLFAMTVMGERRPLSTLGLGRVRISSLGWGLLAGLFAILAFPACAIALQLLGVKSQAAAAGVAGLTAMPLWARLLTLATAGFCEEVLYRGYPITRLKALTGSRLLAVLLPGAVFVAVHAPSWGVAHLLYVSVVTVIMTVLFLWRKDLWSNITAHVVTDAVPLLVMPLLMHR
jgi:membrane protease YdiL (CAAX protease family)